MKPNTFTESVVLAPVTAATAVRTANIDCQDADYCTIRVVLGAEANTNSTNVAMTIAEGDTTSSVATFDADFNRTVDNTAGVVAVSHIDMEGRKRYFKLTLTPDSTTNGAVITSATAALRKPVQTGAVSDLGDDVIVG